MKLIFRRFANAESPRQPMGGVPRPSPFRLGNRLHVHSFHTDTRPVLVFVTYTGIGDLLMALPLFGTLRPQLQVLPVIQSSYTDLAEILHQDGLLEGYLLAEGSLKFSRNPLGHLLTCRALSRLRPNVVLIYGKLMFAYGARLGLLRAGRVLFCHPRGFAPPATRTFEVLAPTGNQTRDYLQFAEKLGVPAAPARVGLTERSKERLSSAARQLVRWSPYAVVAPWTSDRRREAPLRFFRECIEIIITEGRLPVVVTGLPQDRPAASELLRGFSDRWIKDLVGTTTPQDMLGILAGGSFLFTNDGGTLHLARLVGTPAIVAVGPTAPEQRLLDPSQGLVALRLGLPCSPCADTPLRYQCPGAYLGCLRGLQASDARSALLAACQAPAKPVS
jgi:ADP-heptose:LPS heptosyltransferase